MTPRRLLIAAEAEEDIARRVERLQDARGAVFAREWADGLLQWLGECAAGGAQLGTAHPTAPQFRTFGYRRQATVLAEFAGDELRIVRVFFPGQDWTVPG